MQKTEYELQIGPFTVYVTRKKIKNMYLRVKENGTVTVSAPMRISNAVIRNFVMERQEWIRQAQARMPEAARTDKPELTPALEAEYRRYLKREITDLIAKWEPVMKVHPAGFTIRKMKTRWGSCNVKTHHMNFSLALAGVPEPYIEYVVVHEMTHILEPGHNARFWGYMEYYLPGAKRLRKELNQYYICH